MNNDHRDLPKADPSASDKFVFEGLDCQPKLTPEDPPRKRKPRPSHSLHQSPEEQLVFGELTRLNERLEAPFEGGK